MEIPDEIRHYISLNFIYSDKRRMHRNKLLSFMWVSLYCTSEGFNLSIRSNLFCNMKRNKKKKTFFKRVELPLCLLIHLPNLAQRPCWCLRSTSAVPGLLRLHHQEMLELGLQTGKRADKNQEVLPKSLKDFPQDRQHFLNYSTNRLQKRLWSTVNFVKC